MSGLDERLARERRARLQAERLLALRSEELYSANRKLAEHAHALSYQVIEQREENAALKGRTTQVAAELEVATGRADLAERRLWDALTAVEDGFAIFDRDCRLVAANPAFLGPFDGIADVAPGASYDAILRISVDEGIIDLEGAHPDDWIERMLTRWERANIPRVDIRLWNGAFVRLIDKRTPQGDTVCLGLDITTTIRRERDLKTARDAALAASRAKSAFLANMSHEIRTPMNGVVSMAEMLGETELDADQKLYAETIRHSGEALLVIINDILDYSKIEAGKLALHMGEFDLLEVILEVFGLLRPGVEGRDIALLLDLDLQGPDRLIGDCGRVRQVLFNLVGNAVKFTETGHVRVIVRGTSPPDGGPELQLTIAVEDTGIGIAPEMQAHIFGEFNQVEDQANRSHDGTGLGLAITRRLVAMMAGEIDLVSEPGKGSTFTCRLALRRATVPVGADDPIRLAGDARRVRLIGPTFSDRASGLMRMLAVLGASVRAEPAPGTIGAGETVILIAEAAQAAAWASALRDAGFAGPVLHLCERPEEGVPGLEPLILPSGAPELALRLADAVKAAGPAGSTEGPWCREGGRLSVLAAEDNRTNRLVFRTMLKTLDLDLTLVENGAELVEAYRSLRPDMVFTDISMPVMDGMEAVALIRAHEAEEGLARVPIVAMTAHALEGDRERILAAGMDDYMTKPLKKPALLARIADLAPEGRNPVS
ncbi:ATP-binding protein [Roseibacterium sp. SDUM158016]|uniref:ATP-binding protein n=1 Tax=Roseicyclus sediminis TaxID=2980997 RepID=UPI0021D139B6|nr:ATP-binding protein [Roseibacterium sp. SDUM158016]MCU4652220.1 ATP-binding protein [Roseibacterium sp. SDUM158016]